MLQGPTCTRGPDIRSRNFLVKPAVSAPQVELTTCSLQWRYRWKLQHRTCTLSSSSSGVAISPYIENYIMSGEIMKSLVSVLPYLMLWSSIDRRPHRTRTLSGRPSYSGHVWGILRWKVKWYVWWWSQSLACLILPSLTQIHYDLSGASVQGVKIRSVVIVQAGAGEVIDTAQSRHELPAQWGESLGRLQPAVSSLGWCRRSELPDIEQRVEHLHGQACVTT